MNEKINNLILELNSACNNNCIYCYLEKRDCAGEWSMDFFRNELKKFSKTGVKNIDFTGGEPTLYKGLFELVNLAKKAGFAKRTLVTNGRRLAYEDYCKKVLESGINRVVISFDGPNEKIAEAITRSPGSFSQTIKAINNIKNLSKCEIGATVVINKINYKHIPEIVKKCVSLGVDFMNFQFILPYIEDKHISCRRLPSSIIPSYKETREYVTKTLEEFGNKIKINIHFIPFCLLEGYEKYLMDEASKMDRYALNYKGFGYNIGEHLIKGAVKPEKCNNCRYNDKCIGFFSSYAKEFGVLNDKEK